MVNLMKYEEKYCWRAHFDEYIVDEFYEENNKLIETPFSEINQKYNFKKLELISDIEGFKGTNISVNNKGLFTILDKEYLFTLNELNSDKNLFEDFCNNLIMYRTDMQIPGGKSIRYAYTIGYKITNEDIFARLKLINGAEGVAFKIEITAKREFENDCILHIHDKTHKIKLIKDKTITIDIK